MATLLIVFNLNIAFDKHPGMLHFENGSLCNTPQITKTQCVISELDGIIVNVVEVYI